MGLVGLTQQYFILCICVFCALSQNITPTEDPDVYLVDGYADDNDLGTNLTAMRPLNPPDFVICDNEYGQDLELEACTEAFDKLKKGDQFDTFVTQKRYPGEKAYKVPYYITNVDEGKITRAFYN